MAFVRFDVNVASAVAHCLRQQRVEQADDRCIVCRLQQIFYRRQFLHHAAQVSARLDLDCDQRGAGLALRIDHADALHQYVCSTRLHNRHGVLAKHLAESTQGRRFMQHQFYGYAVVLQQQLVLAREAIWQRKLHALYLASAGFSVGVAGWVLSVTAGGNIGAPSTDDSTGLAGGCWSLCPTRIKS